MTSTKYETHHVYEGDWGSGVWVDHQKIGGSIPTSSSLNAKVSLDT